MFFCVCNGDAAPGVHRGLRRRTCEIVHVLRGAGALAVTGQQLAPRALKHVQPHPAVVEWPRGVIVCTLYGAIRRVQLQGAISISFPAPFISHSLPVVAMWEWGCPGGDGGTLGC